MKGKWWVAFAAILLIVPVGVYYAVDPENQSLDEDERQNLGGTYIPLSAGVTHYKLSGPADGKVVVLVHGGTVPSWTWDKQVNFLNAAGFRTLIYDQYGRGYSDRPAVTYDQTLYAGQLLEIVEKLEIPQNFDLVGLSLGGATVVNFTSRYPDRVGNLVLISPVIRNFKVPGIFQIPVAGEFAARLIGIRTIVDRSTSLFDGNPDAEKYIQLFNKQTTYKGFQRSVLSMLRNNALGDYTNAYQKLGRQNRKILLIWGTEDKEITRDRVEDIRSFLPDLAFTPVEGVGHGIVFQKPDTINSLLIDFLQQT